MKEKLISAIREALKSAGVEFHEEIALAYPDQKFGDISTNIAMVLGKKIGSNPKELAQKIIDEMKKKPPEFVESMNIAGPGFVNFFLKDALFFREVLDGSIVRQSPKTGKTVLVEHTDPNTFKPFHIGYLMANAIGESLGRLLETNGDEVKKICYPSDIGLHIAKSIWAIFQNQNEIPADDADIIEKTAFLGKMYALGTKMYEEDPEAKKAIDELNEKIYDKSEKEVNEWFLKGKKWSMEHFFALFQRLGSEFDLYIYESEVAPIGLNIVNAKVGNVFEKSEGAVVFHGEKFGLHTRVFVNSHGLPTYETKEIGLNTVKFEKFPGAELSLVITANEQNDYFKVLLKAFSLLDPNIAKKTKHLGHGMLRLSSGKMSSRTGNVITAEDLIGQIKDLVLEKMRKEQVEKSKNTDLEETADIIAIAAIKYTILRQAVGSDIVFDSAKSISFEGDSGPYLQYSVVRAKSVLEKAGSLKQVTMLPQNAGKLEKLLVRFDDTVERSRIELAPQQVAQYLTALAGEFNAFYSKQTIVDEKDPLSPYYIVLTQAFVNVMERGLWLLGIKVPKWM